MQIEKVAPYLPKLTSVTRDAIAQVPIGDAGTPLPPISGIDPKKAVTPETLLTNTQSVLNNACTTNTGWTLSGAEKDAFMEVIRATDFTDAHATPKMRDAVRIALAAIQATLENLI